MATSYSIIKYIVRCYYKSLKLIFNYLFKYPIPFFVTILPFSFIWKFEECLKTTSVGLTYELITNYRVDLLIAPPCNNGGNFFLYKP